MDTVQKGEYVQAHIVKYTTYTYVCRKLMY